VQYTADADSVNEAAGVTRGLVDGGSGGRLWVNATLREGSLVLVVRGETPAVASVDPVLGDLRQRLSRVYGLDPARFARIHRSTLVNLDRVAEIQPWFSGDGMVLLQGGAKLRLSRSYRQALEERLGWAGPRREGP
jgi:hypothetical protein